ncbi:hypothetical protein CEXT_446161 [Caerostris extrusa]|uniref:Uncharacterized protein n=1 Tax=Caerostris extrusa TaxID=172846 RepID=A0AAV4YBG8_CAEEX|nr:hypothetical protein CEXT_446161 [Caerostris extrusa]
MRVFFRLTRQETPVVSITAFNRSSLSNPSLPKVEKKTRSTLYPPHPFWELLFFFILSSSERKGVIEDGVRLTCQEMLVVSITVSTGALLSNPSLPKVEEKHAVPLYPPRPFLELLFFFILSLFGKEGG